MELRKEWREAVHAFIQEKWKDAFAGLRNNEIQDLTYKDLALRLQSLADKERREAVRVGWKAGESSILAAHTVLPSPEESKGRGEASTVESRVRQYLESYSFVDMDVWLKRGVDLYEMGRLAGARQAVRVGE